MRPRPICAAEELINYRFPESMAAFVAGSVIRGDGTETSDLDVVVITDREEAPFRESLTWQGWPVELFVHTLESYGRYFSSDAKERTPSLPTMCLEGAVVRDSSGLAARIKEEARHLLEAGPEPLTQEELDTRRYFISDLLDDFIGSHDRCELLFIAPCLVDTCVWLILAADRRWCGEGKWLLRAFRLYDHKKADVLVQAMEAFYSGNDKSRIIAFVESALDAVGGRLFDGFKVGGRRASPG